MSFLVEFCRVDSEARAPAHSMHHCILGLRLETAPYPIFGPLVGFVPAYHTTLQSMSHLYSFSPSCSRNLPACLHILSPLLDLPVHWATVFFLPLLAYYPVQLISSFTSSQR